MMDQSHFCGKTINLKKHIMLYHLRVFIVTGLSLLAIDAVSQNYHLKKNDLETNDVTNVARLDTAIIIL